MELNQKMAGNRLNCLLPGTPHQQLPESPAWRGTKRGSTEAEHGPKNDGRAREREATVPDLAQEH